MCTVLLPPDVNPIAVNKYININRLYISRRLNCIQNLSSSYLLSKHGKIKIIKTYKTVIFPFHLYNSETRSRSDSLRNLTFAGPGIAIYFYSKTNQIHNISNLFYFGTTLYMFRTVSPSIIRSLRLYIQHHTKVL